MLESVLVFFLQAINHKLPSNEFVDCLISECDWLEILKKQNKPYNSLLDYLIELGKLASIDPDEYYDRESTKVKTISEKTSISPSKVRNWIFKVYDDLFGLNLKIQCFLRKKSIIITSFHLIQLTVLTEILAFDYLID